MKPKSVDARRTQQLVVVGMIDPAEPRHNAHKGARIGGRIGELEATAGGQEGDVGGAPGQHIDNAVADLDDAAADHRAAGDLHQAAGGSINFETTPSGTMGKREPQTILRTDERSIHRELARAKIFTPNQSVGVKTGVSCGRQARGRSQERPLGAHAPGGALSRVN